jgi:glycerophosphoryl diester phosphodiesterase
MPENTIPSMIKAIEVGANVIEVDIYTSKDGKVLVTHDAFINRDFSLLPDGSEIPAADAKKHLVHQMNYEDIRKFDVGLKSYQAFPKQEKIAAYIPLLGELIDSVENYTSSHKLSSTIYNIELKTAVSYDSVYNAKPEELVDAVLKVVKDKKIGKRFYIQSFDYRPLQYIHRQYPEVSLAFLTGSEQSFEKNIEELGFRPQIYSPHYNLVSAQLVQKCKNMNIRIVPWTVNNVDEMKRIKNLGVDGIITDFPDYFTEIK